LAYHGYTVSPLDVIFIKTNRNLSPNELIKYTGLAKSPIFHPTRV
jgi:hypothetical protein